MAPAPRSLFLRNQGLFSQHYLAERLPLWPAWAEPLEGFNAALQTLYQKAKLVAARWNEAQTEQAFIRPVLDLLGWEYLVQAPYRQQGQHNIPDYALFAEVAAKQAAQTTDHPYTHATAVCDAKAWGRDLDAAPKNDALTHANPSFQIVNYLVGTGVAWGILTNGRVWRLYAQNVRSRITTFFEVDVAGALAAHDATALRFFALFFRRAAFHPRPGLTETVLTESAAYAVAVQDELKTLVFEQVAPRLVQGFVAWRQAEQGVTAETPAMLAEVYQATLILLYRVLFLFYAEARGLLPAHDERGYGQVALTRLTRQIAAQQDQGTPFGTRATLLWGALQSLFRIVAKGDAALRVPVYNGGLFDAHPRPGALALDQLALADADLAAALDDLARRFDPARGARVFIDYRDLDVRHLGSVYEGLLEFQPRLEKNGAVALVNDKGQRKASGSYYTPDYVVKHIVAQTLAPVWAARAAQFRALMAEWATLTKKRQRHWPEERATLAQRLTRTVLDLRVCDPAMGSGHFLVETVGYLSDQLAALLAEYPENPVAALIETTRAQIIVNLREQQIEPDLAQLDDQHLLKRLVMKRCIYGVDLNPMAVELAKLSLWLDSFTSGEPFALLNHHLKPGDSIRKTFDWKLAFPDVFIDHDPAPGFDAIVANPPYVDVSPDPYFRQAFACGAAGNLYAYLLENSGLLLTPTGRMGLIVPMSLACSERMADARQWLVANCAVVSVAHFGIRPAKIFPGVDQRVTIVLAQKAAIPAPCELRATRFHRWHEGEAPALLENLHYTDISALPHQLGWPKLGDETGREIARKLAAQPQRLGDYLDGDWRFFYHGIGRYWLKAYNFAPTYFQADGQPGRSSTLFELHARSAEMGAVALALLNSSLFFWYWVLYGDDFHLQRREIHAFPFTYHAAHRPLYAQLKKLGTALMRDYKKHSVLKRGQYASGAITWQEFYPRHSKPLIDEIDEILGMLYGLTPAEVAYVQQYDVAFRLGEAGEG